MNSDGAYGFFFGAVVGVILALGAITLLIDSPVPRLDCESRSSIWVCRSIPFVGSNGKSVPTESCSCVDGGTVP